MIFVNHLRDNWSGILLSKALYKFVCRLLIELCGCFLQLYVFNILSGSGSGKFLESGQKRDPVIKTGFFSNSLRVLTHSIFHFSDLLQHILSGTG